MQDFKTERGFNCRYLQRVQFFLVMDEPGDVKSAWKDLKELKVCEETKGIIRGEGKRRLQPW